MKKIIVVLFILLLGLFALGGCVTNVQESNTLQPNQAQPEQNNQQNSGNNNNLQPPALPEE